MRVLIRIFALITTMITAAWLYSDVGYDTWFAFLTSVIGYLFWEFSSAKNDEAGALGFSDLESAGEFASEVGLRMRFIREELLQISKREMVEFLNLNSVSLLESYESGKEEYPLYLLKKIEMFFRINSRFVETGESSVNKKFSLCANSFSKLINKGYSPYILCCSDQRADLFCYIVMKRRCEGFIQVAIADLLCSFTSNGGGRLNIGNLIDAMIDNGVGTHKAHVLTASADEWKALREGYYFVNDRVSWGEGVDFECQRIFNKYYNLHSACKKQHFF